MTALSFLFAAAAVVADPATHSVTFTAHSPDPGIDTPLEFLFVGPKSDRDYESMFVTDAEVADIVRGFAEAGIPVGRPVDADACRFWPIGSALKFEPDIWTFIRDVRNERKRAPVYTGGVVRSGAVEADTNMPCAVFSLYNLSQSLIQFDDTLDQSVVYGRFVPAVKIPKGEKRTFKVTWTGGDNGGKHEHTPDFRPDMTVAEARKLAQALAELDGPDTKINGFKPGQFFYRAFIPMEKWRDRKERLTQPLEVYLGATNRIVVVDEDWTVEGLDPKLTPREISLADARRLEKVTTCLVFAPKETKLESVYAIARELPETIRNWYVYGD